MYVFGGRGDSEGPYHSQVTSFSSSKRLSMENVESMAIPSLLAMNSLSIVFGLEIVSQTNMLSFTIT